MEQNLKQYLSDHPCKGFRPVPHYFPKGDYVTFYAKDERCFAERVDDLLTIFLSNRTGELVGCKFEGVKQLVSEMGEFGVVFESVELALELFCVLGKSTARDRDQRRRYDELIPLVKGAVFSSGNRDPIPT